MALLDAMSVARIADDMADLFPESATILRAVETRDAVGGRIQTWSTAASVTCRVHAVGGVTDTVTSGEAQDATVYRVAFPVGTDLRLTDRVNVVGLSLAVIGVARPTSLSLELVASATRCAA